MTALARGLLVLRAFKSGEERLGNHELAVRCNLPKSTISRLTYTLVKLGFLHQVEESGNYRLGMATLTLGGTTLSHLDVRQASAAILQEVADKTLTMVSLGLLDDLSMVYIATHRSEAAVVTLRLDVGSRLPIASTAMGRTYLAASPPAIREQLIERLQTLDAAAWKRALPEVRKAMSDYARTRCTYSFGEWKQQINGMATPLQLTPDLPLIIINAAAPSHLTTPEHFLTNVQPLLLDAATRISKIYLQTTGKVAFKAK
ncbi:IclR family transcriptional regulator [Ottowia thiooxydans]|uniref:IclR family transcriptional regulator n=1 Tax=Ottowia thiooxydans TaxID=219182 RepID=UPI0033907FE3